MNGWTTITCDECSAVQTSALASGMVPRWPMVTLLTPVHQLNKPAKLCSLATIHFGLIAHSIRVHHSVHSWTSLGQTAGGMSWCNSPQVEHRSPPLLGCPRSVTPWCCALGVLPSGWRSHPLGEEMYKAIWKFAAILPSWWRQDQLQMDANGIYEQLWLPFPLINCKYQL